MKDEGSITLMPQYKKNLFRIGPLSLLLSSEIINHVLEYLQIAEKKELEIYTSRLAQAIYERFKQDLDN